MYKIVSVRYESVILEAAQKFFCPPPPNHKSVPTALVFLGWVVGRFNIAVNGEHNCGVLPVVQANCVYVIKTPTYVSISSIAIL